MHRRIERNPKASRLGKVFHGTVCQAWASTSNETTGNWAWDSSRPITSYQLLHSAKGQR